MTDITTVPGSIPELVNIGISPDAARDPEDAHADDDHRWLATVLASLPKRSAAARQALAEALMNGSNKAAPVGCASFPIVA